MNGSQLTRELREEYIVANQARAAEIAAQVYHRACPRNLDMDELRGEALMLLVQVADSFDPSRNVPFDRYIKVPIMRGLISFIRRWMRTSYASWKQIQAGKRKPVLQYSLEPDVHADPSSFNPGRMPGHALEVQETANWISQTTSWEERILLTLRYQDRLSYQEIGDTLAKPALRCRQIHHDIMLRLRSRSNPS